MKVLKFGGTSLGNPIRMKNVAEIVSTQAEETPVLVVLSAVAGTTDSLVKIVSAAQSSQLNEAEKEVVELTEKYAYYIDALFSSSSMKEIARKFIETQMEDIQHSLQQRYIPSLEFQLLAKGEIISTELFYLLLQEQQKKVDLLYALDLLRLDQDLVPDEKYLESQFNELMSNRLEQNIWVTQGFICRNAFGEVSNLKRGGSDYSASLFAAALNADEVQIWTDIDGMHNNDPRFVENTRPISELSFDEAAELAYFGAKILHPSSIKPARKKNIPVRLLNTLEPKALGTLVSNKSIRANIKAVAAKGGITAIKIRSSEMLQAPGFLRRVFEVFELYHTSIDTITTSEVAVSVTIDDTSYLKDIARTLEEFGHVEIDEELSIICVVGEFLEKNTGIASQVIGALEDIPIRMISYGGSAHNISLLVSQEYKVKALNRLHQRLFNV